MGLHQSLVFRDGILCFSWSVVALLLLALCGCGDNKGETEPAQILDARVILPEYPYEENSAIEIDARLLDDLALEFLRDGGGAEEIPGFLFSYVPVWAFDELAGAGSSRMETLEGLLYLSGFFGGLWLKGVLHPESIPVINSGVPFIRQNRAVDTMTGFVSLASVQRNAGCSKERPIQSDSLKGLEENLFTLLASLASGLNDRVRSGAADSLNGFLQNSMNMFIFLYGYNLGYLQSILDHPPEGMTPPSGYLACNHFLDCVTPVQGISILEELLPLVENLKDPPNSRWEQMRDKVETNGPVAVDMGYDVWNDHLSVENMLPEDYRVLLDLSAGFLLYCQVLVLSSMDAWVVEHEEMARTAVAVSAGMTAWVGGYGIGLVSSYPGGHLPSIEVDLH